MRFLLFGPMLLLPNLGIAQTWPFAQTVKNCEAVVTERLAYQICKCSEIESDLLRLECFDEFSEELSFEDISARAATLKLGATPFGRLAMRKWYEENIGLEPR